MRAADPLGDELRSVHGSWTANAAVAASRSTPEFDEDADVTFFRSFCSAGPERFDPSDLAGH